jgi:hypothetical protein
MCLLIFPSATNQCSNDPGRRTPPAKNMKQNGIENFLSAVASEHESNDYSDNGVNRLGVTVEPNHLEMKMSIFTKSLV